ncbi:MAG: hypothetical protein HOJ34_08235, partial [Kordiimonadaceae bacterium]|nr:hypothetical protein [Kordiimonadaceae bacterium]
MNRLKLIIIIALSTLFITPAFAATYEVTMKPGNVYNMAAFKMWTPPNVDNFRGILMLNPGSNGDGRSQVDDKYWQDFAVKHNFALLGTFLTDHMHPNMMIEDYIQVGKG